MMMSARTEERATLLASIYAATLAVKAASSASRFEAAMMRFHRLLQEWRLERRYNPNWRCNPACRGGSREPDNGQTGRLRRARRRSLDYFSLPGRLLASRGAASTKP